MEQKPPIGLRPRRIAVASRIQEIDEAIQRYIDAGYAFPDHWTDERNELLNWLRKHGYVYLGVKEERQ